MSIICPRSRAQFMNIRNGFNFCYLAGPITGIKSYRDNFSAAREFIKSFFDGISVVDPSFLPDGFKYEAYLRMTFPMIDECDSICLLDDWSKSKGTLFELQHIFLSQKEYFVFSLAGAKLCCDTDNVGKIDSFLAKFNQDIDRILTV